LVWLNDAGSVICCATELTGVPGETNVFTVGMKMKPAPKLELKLGTPVSLMRHRM